MWDPRTGTGPAPMRTHSATTSTKADEFRRIEVITGVGRRRRWTDEEKAWIVAESLDPATTAETTARALSEVGIDGVEVRLHVRVAGEASHDATRARNPLQHRKRRLRITLRDG